MIGRLVRCVRVTSLATLLASSAVPSAANAGAGGMETIAAYRGTWIVRIVHHKTRYSKARTESSTVRNDCWRSVEYYACHQFADGKSAALIVYTYDATHDVYHTHAIVPGAASAPGGVLKIAGRTWTYPWQDTDDRGKTVFVRIVNTFRDPNTIDFRQEFSTDDAHWTRTADGVEHRLHSRGSP